MIKLEPVYQKIWIFLILVHLNILMLVKDLVGLNRENVCKKPRLKELHMFPLDPCHDEHSNRPDTLNSSSETPILSSFSLMPKLTLEPTHDEITRVISNFLFHKCMVESFKYIEIEVKMGQILDLITKERLRLPVLTETSVIFLFLCENINNNLVINSDELRVKFESNMTEVLPA
ncbi:hypothetical protein PCK2_000418 [Pneumocystis canis]|nr:hypothetical protein PCK2_000418 [Pneumocystis canis]